MLKESWKKSFGKIYLKKFTWGKYERKVLSMKYKENYFRKERIWKNLEMGRIYISKVKNGKTQIIHWKLYSFIGKVEPEKRERKEKYISPYSRTGVKENILKWTGEIERRKFNTTGLTPLRREY